MGFGPFFFEEDIMLNRRADKLELLRIAEAVALEKSIDKELIINSMETGIAKAAKSKFGNENEIQVNINRESGDIEIFRKLIIVEKPENNNTEISLERAKALNNEKKLLNTSILFLKYMIFYMQARFYEIAQIFKFVRYFQHENCLYFNYHRSYWRFFNVSNSRFF